MSAESADAPVVSADLSWRSVRRRADRAAESPLQQLPTTRRAILNLLKRQGPLDAAAVAGALALTPAAIRLQLTHLEDDGLLAHRDEVAEGRGAAGPVMCTS